jgi:hypothetical protein
MRGNGFRSADIPRAGRAALRANLHVSRLCASSSHFSSSCCYIGCVRPPIGAENGPLC